MNILQKYEVQSKKTYSSAKGAERAGIKDKGEKYTGVHQLPNGKFCYCFYVRISK